jgi:hypothetical protein
MLTFDNVAVSLPRFPALLNLLAVTNRISCIYWRMAMEFTNRYWI